MPDEPICDFVEPFKGWRVFLFDGQRISSLNGTIWTTNTMKARCIVKSDHDIPDAGCTCGIYAYKHPSLEIFNVCRHDRFGVPKVQFDGFNVAAEVELWGGVVRHIDGYRAENCRILRLFIHSGYAYRAFGRSVNRELERLGRSWGIEFQTFIDAKALFRWKGKTWALRNVLPKGVPVCAPSPISYNAAMGKFPVEATSEMRTVMIQAHCVDCYKSDYTETGTVFINYETEEEHAARKSNRQGYGGREV
jgi:hypothetical protein